MGISNRSPAFQHLLMLPRCPPPSIFPATSHVVLVLDVWAVHKSEEFRKFIRTQHPRIHLVYVPPNCTSELQVADVILQRPFKASIRRSFNKWAAEIIREQIRDETPLGLAPYLKMSLIKPLILEWCIEAWNSMAQGREYIKTGLAHMHCISLQCARPHTTSVGG